MLALETLRTARDLLPFVDLGTGVNIGGIEMKHPAQAAFVIGDLIQLYQRGGEATVGLVDFADEETRALVTRIGKADATAAAAMLDDLEGRGVDTATCRQALGSIVRAGAPVSMLQPLTIGRNYVVEPRSVRRFVAPGLQRGKVAGWASAPGVGKSTLGLQTGLAIVAENGGLIGGPVEFTGPVVAVMNEDDADEIGRRIDAVLKGFGLVPADLKHPLHIFGANHPLVLFERSGQREPLRPTPQFQALADFIRQDRPALVILDTLASCVRGADENDAGDMQAIMSALSKLAGETDTATLVVTHTAKAAAGRSGDQHAVRGSSAITGAMRSVFTLAPLGEDSARSFGLSPADAHRWVRMDAAKSNYGPTGQTTWFERDLIQLLAADARDPTKPVFETVAILRPRSKGPAVGLSGLDMTGIVVTIGAGFDGRPPLADRRAKESVYGLLHERYSLEAPMVAVLVDQLRRAGVVTVERRKDPKSRHERNVVLVAPDADAKLATMMNAIGEAG